MGPEKEEVGQTYFVNFVISGADKAIPVLYMDVYDDTKTRSWLDVHVAGQPGTECTASRDEASFVSNRSIDKLTRFTCPGVMEYVEQIYSIGFVASAIGEFTWTAVAWAAPGPDEAPTELRVRSQKELTTFQEQVRDRGASPDSPAMR